MLASVLTAGGCQNDGGSTTGGSISGASPARPAAAYTGTLLRVPISADHPSGWVVQPPKTSAIGATPTVIDVELSRVAVDAPPLEGRKVLISGRPIGAANGKMVLAVTSIAAVQ
jgi:hypothetical protein